MATRAANNEELLEFVNKVRVAGRAGPLKKLKTGAPGRPGCCLLARNLNFACEVNGLQKKDIDEWYMYISDPNIADKIATSLQLKRHSERCVWLPKKIGLIAHEFDHWDAALDSQTPVVSATAKRRLARFWPLLDSSVRKENPHVRKLMKELS